MPLEALYRTSRDPPLHYRSVVFRTEQFLYIFVRATCVQSSSRNHQHFVSSLQLFIQLFCAPRCTSAALPAQSSNPQKVESAALPLLRLCVYSFFMLRIDLSPSSSSVNTLRKHLLSSQTSLPTEKHLAPSPRGPWSFVYL